MKNHYPDSTLFGSLPLHTHCVEGMEIMGPKFRDVTGIMVQAWFAVGLMILPGAAYFIRDHVHLQWMMAMTPVIMILYAL